MGKVCTGMPKRCEVDSQPGVDFEVTKSLLGMVCETQNDGGEYTLNFELAPETKRFSLSIFTSKGTLRPTTIRIDGNSFEVASINKTQNVRAEHLNRFPTPYGANNRVAFDWTLIFPYSDFSTSYVEPGGTYELDVSTTDTAPCWYLIEDSENGTRLDVNYRFVGTGIDAKSAPTDANFRGMHERFVDIIDSAGVRIDNVRYFDAPTSLVERFRIIRGRSDIEALTGWARGIDDSLEGHLSVDVFLVDGFVSGALGTSASLPGAPGNHGSPSQGLVLSLLDLGFDNDLVAHTLAHEVGHFLGLRHTTEASAGSEKEEEFDRIGLTDPHTDTPTCANVLAMLDNCPDFQNLMFPFPPSTIGSIPLISPHQSSAMQSHPVVKSEH